MLELYICAASIDDQRISELYLCVASLEYLFMLDVRALPVRCLH